MKVESSGNDLKARVLAAARSKPSPTRSTVARRAAALLLASCAASFAVFELWGGVRPTGRPLLLMVGTALGTCVISAAAAWVSLSRGRSTLGRPTRFALPAAAAAAPLIVAWKLLWSSHFASALDAWPTRPGFRCLALNLAIAVCPLMAFLISRRFSDPRQPAVNGLVAGLSIGAAANVLTDLWCPVAYLPHLLLGHVLPVLLLGAVGSWIGQLLESRSPN
jgi:hypothetical protein